MPLTLVKSSIEACFTPANVPKCFNRARLRLGADARHIIQRGGERLFLAYIPVVTDCEAVRLVPHPLEQLQPPAR